MFQLGTVDRPARGVLVDYGSSFETDADGFPLAAGVWGCGTLFQRGPEAIVSQELSRGTQISYVIGVVPAGWSVSAIKRPRPASLLNNGLISCVTGTDLYASGLMLTNVICGGEEPYYYSIGKRAVEANCTRQDGGQPGPLHASEPD
jgi:hypothetical protein